MTPRERREARERLCPVPDGQCEVVRLGTLDSLRRALDALDARDELLRDALPELGRLRMFVCSCGRAATHRWIGVVRGIQGPKSSHCDWPRCDVCPTDPPEGTRRVEVPENVAVTTLAAKIRATLDDKETP